MTTISTASLNSQVLGSAMQLENTWGTAESQQSSQLVSTNFAGLGASSRRLLDLEDQISTTKAYQSGTQTASDLAQSMYGSIGTMISTLTTLRSQLSAAMSESTSNGYSDLNSTGSSSLNEMAGLINTKQNGAYVFAGSQTTAPPITVSTTAPGYTYNGDSYVASVKVSDSQTVSYGVLGSNQAFKDALNACYQASTASSSTNIASAYQLAETAVTELSNLQEQTSGSANVLASATATQTSMLSICDTSLSDVKNVDAAQISAVVTGLQTNLDASFQAVASTLKMNLTQYL